MELFSKLKLNLRSSQSGFTLIELLLVISLIGIISGVMVTTINVQKQKDIAREGVMQDNLHKVAEVVESYKVLEGDYPVSCGSSAPTTCSGNEALAELVDIWPSDIQYVAESDQSDFAIYSSSIVTTDKYFKYSSDWEATSAKDFSVRECGSQDVGVVGGCSPIGSVAGTPTPTLVGILLSPSSPTTSIGVSATRQFTAQGLFSDGSSSSLPSIPSWSTSNSNATVNATGLVTGVSVGTSGVRATLNGINGVSNFTVTTLSPGTAPPPTPSDSVVVTSVSGSTAIDIGNSVQVNACFSDAGGPCSDITLSTSTEWSSTNQNILSITRTASSVTVTGVSTGTADVIATYGGVIGRLRFTVTSLSSSRTPTSLAVLPTGNPVRLEDDSSQQFVARVYYSDGTSALVTNSSIWTIVTGEGVVSLSTQTRGLVLARSPGTASVRASYTENNTTLNNTVNIQVISTFQVSCSTNRDCSTFSCTSGTPVCNTFLRICECTSTNL